MFPILDRDLCSNIRVVDYQRLVADQASPLTQLADSFQKPGRDCFATSFSNTLLFRLVKRLLNILLYLLALLLVLFWYWDGKDVGFAVEQHSRFGKKPCSVIDVRHGLHEETTFRGVKGWQLAILAKGIHGYAVRLQVFQRQWK